MSRNEKILAVYLLIGVAVRLSGRAITTTINIENSLLSAVLWPAVLLNGFDNVPLFPPVINNQSNPVPQNAAQ